MSDEESWGPMKHLVRRITSRSIGQIWLHHTGHDATKGYGTKTREWEMDTVVRLAFADDNEAIAMEFRKARLRTPENFEQFQSATIRCTRHWMDRRRPAQPKPGKTLDQVDPFLRAFIDAYHRLADTVDKTPGLDGKTVIRSR